MFKGKSGLVMQTQICCDKCPTILTYCKQPEGDYLLHHGRAGCERDFQMFEPPMLKQVRTTLHPDV
jgi:hypothetical protein